jgi:cytoskeleton protein RodZ
VFLRAVKSPYPKPERDAPASPGADFVGDVLQRQREALGLDLSEVAEALKIKAPYLAALEAGSPGQLPGPVYAVGFLRAYANHLGLDADEMLRRFKQDSAALGRKPDLAFPMPLGERSIPGSGMLLVAAILAFCGYGTWHFLSTAERSQSRRRSPRARQKLGPLRRTQRKMHRRPPKPPTQPPNQLRRPLLR